MDHWDAVKNIQLTFSGVSIQELIAKIEKLDPIKVEEAIVALQNATKKLTKQEQLVANLIEIAKIVTTVITA